jgi:uncharacterized membrane protein YbhN (UPF0104 family)
VKPIKIALQKVKKTILSFWNKTGKWIKLLLKILISGVAIYYILSKLDFSLIITTIKSVKIELIIVALFIYVISILFAAERLNCLFRKINLKLSFFENIKLYWLGIFFFFFLPGGVGGDGYKIYFIEKYLNIKIKKSLGAILSDRISGLTIIAAFLIFFSYFINYDSLFQNINGVLILFLHALITVLQKFIWILIPLVVLCFYFILRMINGNFVRSFFPVLGRAFVVQSLQMITAIVILFALGLNISGSTGDYIFLFFLSAIMGSIPITLGGIGVRELTLFIGAQYLGLNENIAVSLSLLFYAISVITALPGLIYTINPDKILTQFNRKNATS